MAKEIDDESDTMGDRLFEQRTIALTELIEALFEPLLKAGKDVLRRFRFALSAFMLGHAAATW